MDGDAALAAALQAEEAGAAAEAAFVTSLNRDLHKALSVGATPRRCRAGAARRPGVQRGRPNATRAHALRLMQQRFT